MAKRNKKVCKMICPRTMECMKESYEEDDTLTVCDHGLPHPFAQGYKEGYRNCNTVYSKCKTCISVRTKEGREATIGALKYKLIGMPID